MHPAGKSNALAASLLLAGCGYVGDPLPPALNIPVAVTDLAAVQRGTRIIVQCTLPGTTTDGLTLARFGQIDLRIGAEGVRPWSQETWEARASQLEVHSAPGPGLLREETPAANWVGQEVILGLRVSSAKGRWSEWSNLYALNVVGPVAPPTALTVTGVPEGVRVHWDAEDTRPEVRFRLYRRTPGEQTLSFLAEVTGREWIDKETRYGQPYEYIVQAVLPAGDDLAESELADPAAITPEDRFPPAVPAGLKAVAGLNTIEVTWERDPIESGVSYHLHRKEEGGQERRIAEALDLPSYSDRDIVSGKRYSYSVSAVDELANESDRSAPAEAVAP